jgi:hypothetical protein
MNLEDEGAWHSVLLGLDFLRSSAPYFVPQLRVLSLVLTIFCWLYISYLPSLLYLSLHNLSALPALPAHFRQPHCAHSQLRLLSMRGRVHATFVRVNVIRFSYLKVYRRL